MQFKTETVVGLFIVVALGIFFYMTFFLGVFRFDRMNYLPYTVYFNDVSGLEKKADVKIAGVKVGWVEGIELINGQCQAKAHIMVLKRYVLRTNAHAIVRQEGLLGSKYLELLPGDPTLSPLPAGQTLEKHGRSPASVDEILHKVQEIAGNVEEVSDSFQAALGGHEGKEQLRSMVDNFSEAAHRIAQFSSGLDRTLGHNEDSINTILSDLKEFTRDLKEAFPGIRDSIQKVADSVDRDVGKLAEKLENTSVAIEDAALQARDGFKNISSVAEKIDEGKGLIGKLINEDETYRDIKVTVQGLKHYFKKIDSLQIVFDSHGEYMYRPAENLNFEDTKGYFNMRIHPSDDHFYILQYVVSQRGNIKRTLKEVKWFDEDCNELLPSELIKQGVVLPELVGTVEKRKRTLDVGRFGVQFGKIFKNLALRAGLIEGFAGFAVDFDIPFGTDKFRWVTTLEAFDFRGRDRFDDKRPHLKWINRLFLLRNIYFVFGADDFVSKRNANGFFGGGIRFCDDDVKYLLSAVGFGSFG